MEPLRINWDKWNKREAQEMRESRSNAKQALFFGVIGPFIVAVFVLAVGCTAGEFLWAVTNSKTVQGKLVGAEKVIDGSAGALVVGRKGASALFSFAVAIDVGGGEIVTASSEDRQWAVAKPGLCVEAKVFPYPPWDVGKAGTYHDARLIKQWECK